MKRRSHPEPKTKRDPAGKKPLSQSNIWERQRAFYRDQGIAAWENKIPFYATSNPYIANAYANVLIQYMRDLHPASSHSEPFYLLELGAGPGVFSFYVIKRLMELKAALSLAELRFVYVMSDFVDANIRFWQAHPALKKYREAGVLDYARFDMLADRELILIHAQKRLGPDGAEGRRPLIVLANYIFDTIPHDLFKVEDGRIQEGLTNPSPAIPMDLPDNRSLPFKEIGSAFSYRDLALPYYGEAGLDEVLQGSAEELESGCLLFPIGALRVLDTLKALSGGAFFLISSDKGFSAHFRTFARFEPELSFHKAAFSLMVNFRSIGHYFTKQGGDAFHQETHQSITTSAFVLGANFARLPLTRHAAQTFLVDLSPGDLFNIYRHIASTNFDCTLETIISYLNMTHWDPQVFNQNVYVIAELVKAAGSLDRDGLLRGIHKIAENIYHLPKGDDTFANLGLVLQAMSLFEEALHYYRASIDAFGESDVISYNMGLCQFFLENCREAMRMFESAIRLNPDYVMAKGWLSQVKDELDKKEEA